MGATYQAIIMMPDSFLARIMEIRETLVEAGAGHYVSPYTKPENGHWFSSKLFPFLAGLFRIQGIGRAWRGGRSRR
jgi:hypothetical protein